VMALSNLAPTTTVAGTIFSILSSINTATRSQYTWTSLGFLTSPTVMLGTSTALGLDSILPTIVEKFGITSIQATVAACILGSGIIDSTTGLIAATPTSAQMDSCIIASDSTSILANIARSKIGATCTSMNNAILTALSQAPYANYVAPTMVQAYMLGKMMEHSLYFSNLETLSVIGRALQLPTTWNLSSLSKLYSVALNNSIVENSLILPKNLNDLVAYNTTLCIGGMILSNAPNASINNPGFINTKVNNAAIALNMQNATGPLCAGNIGSILGDRSFSFAESYRALYNHIFNELSAEKSLIANIWYNLTNTTVALQNMNNTLLSTMNDLKVAKSTLATCVNSFKAQVIALSGNPKSADITAITSCTPMLA
jgi:hypothetical protein